MKLNILTYRIDWTDAHPWACGMALLAFYLIASALCAPV